jgi:hypothetical protein
VWCVVYVLCVVCVCVCLLVSRQTLFCNIGTCNLNVGVRSEVSLDTWQNRSCEKAIKKILCTFTAARLHRLVKVHHAKY